MLLTSPCEKRVRLLSLIDADDVTSDNLNRHNVLEHDASLRLVLTLFSSLWHS